jgi:hypothetical protein
MSVLTPPPSRPDELEALIREARERQLRRRLLIAAAVAVAAAVGLSVYGLADGGGASPGSASSGGPTSLASASCGVAAGWQLRLGSLWAEQTGQHTAPFVLTRLGPTACTLDGYPGIVLRDAEGRVLPFRYSHRGDQMVTGRAPHAVRVPAHGHAFFVLNKYRCDIRAQDTARLARVRLPGVRGVLRLRLPRYPTLDYCPKDAPSRTVAVTPIVARAAQASAHG